MRRHCTTDPSSFRLAHAPSEQKELSVRQFVLRLSTAEPKEAGHYPTFHDIAKGGPTSGTFGHVPFLFLQVSSRMELVLSFRSGAPSNTSRRKERTKNKQTNKQTMSRLSIVLLTVLAIATFLATAHAQVVPSRLS
jgi:hypothetical protein